MRKTLQLVFALTLFLCGFGLNAQRTPEFRTTQLRNANVTMIIDEHHFPYDISDNGKHVAIQGYGDYSSYYWSEETGVIPMSTGYAFAVSDDGVVAGYFMDMTMGEGGVNVAGLWTPEAQEWSFIGMNPDATQFTDFEYNGAWAMTNDGTKLAVMQYDGSWVTKTYLWTESDGYTLLPHGDSDGSRPNAISADGRVVAGRGVSATTGDWFACYWVDGEFYDFDEELIGEAKAVSPDGNYIAGFDGNSRMFLYDRANDELIVAEDENPQNTYSPTCVTDDGVVFGYSNDAFPPMANTRKGVAFVDGELMSFNDYLLMKGVVEAADWNVYSVNAVTPDGKTFTGAANIDGYDYSFIMTIEEPECQGPTGLQYAIDELDNYDDIVLNWLAPEDAADVTYEIYENYTAETPIVEGLTETTYTFVDMQPGKYSFVVKANWGDCLSPASNIVRPEVSACSSADKCELRFDLYDTYGDGWNGAYIKVYNDETGEEHRVELASGQSNEVVLALCPNVYNIEWVAGEYDSEISFAIYKNDELIYDSTPVGEPVAGLIMKYELNCSEEEIVELDPFIQITNSYAFPYDISDNKKHVAIQSFSDAISYYWSEETGIVLIEGYAFSVSDDGIVAGYYFDRTMMAYLAGLWNVDTGEWTFLGEMDGKEIPTTGTPDAPSDYNAAWAMTNDGSAIAVAYTDPAWNTTSYIWTEDDGYVQLTNGTSQSTRPNAISNDARVVVGHGVADLGWTPCYWINGDLYEMTAYFGEALAVSSSGDYVGGYMDSGEGFVVNTATGELELITSETLLGSFTVVCINNDGDAFGFYNDAFPPMPESRKAFAYIGGQAVTFNDYLAMNGYEGAEDWMFYSVNAVTADGRTFLCSVNIDGNDCSAIVTIPESQCEAPKNLTCVIDENVQGKLTLNWNAPENPVDVTYEIYDDVMSDTPLYSGITETTFTIENLEAGIYNFMVRANWGGECLSMPTNGVKPIIYPCSASDMCELRFELQDEFGDAWNSGRIEIVGTKSDIVYTVEMESGKYEDALTLTLCPDTYSFTWIKGEWDVEVGFAIYNDDEELFSVAKGEISDKGLETFLEYNLDCGIGVEEMTSQNIISLMPNPAKDYFNIEGVDMIDVEVYNAIGQKVETVNVNNDNVQISTADYKEGIYFVKINTSDAGVIVKKVVVTK